LAKPGGQQPILSLGGVDLALHRRRPLIHARHQQFHPGRREPVAGAIAAACDRALSRTPVAPACPRSFSALPSPALPFVGESSGTLEQSGPSDAGRSEGPPLPTGISLPTDKEVISSAADSTGHMAVVGSSDGSLQRVNVQTKQKVGDPMAGHTNKVTSIAFSPDGHTIVSGGDDRTVRLWNADTGEAIGIPLEVVPGLVEVEVAVPRSRPAVW
jgi:hypothetical protein